MSTLSTNGGKPGGHVGERIDQHWALKLQFAAIAGNEPAGSHIELGFRWPSGAWEQRWFPVHELDRAVRAAVDHGRLGDVYVGCAPRTVPKGGKAAIRRVHVLWGDWDTEESGVLLRKSRPLPGIVHRSGTPGHLQGFWPLKQALAPDVAEAANRRIAERLGADRGSTDVAHVLRVPGTLNHKHSPPRPVECVRLELDAFVASEVVGDHLDDEDRADPPRPRTSGHHASNRSAKPVPGRLVRSMPSVEYVPLLTGRAVTAGGFVQCPFHGNGQERTPSLHVSSIDPRWYCHANGCGKGGGLVEFYALLKNRQPPERGVAFVRFAYKIEDALTSARGGGP